MKRALAALLLVAAGTASAAESLRVGSKRFTESYILGEILAQTVRATGVAAEHRPGLGNTGIVFAALTSGAIDLYPEYTGTLAKEILKLEGDAGLEALNRALAPQGLGVAVPLGFSNGYALAMREERAASLGIRTLADLARRPELKLGLSQEFIGRADGWPGLKAAYGLPFATPQGLDHGLAYDALAAGQIDVMDIYTTDAKIERYRLRALEDDRNYFPRYDAALLYRLDLPQRLPGAWRALERLEGRIDAARMIRMNAAAELEGRSFAQAAALLHGDARPVAAARRGFLDTLFGPDFLRLTREHLVLVFVSLAASVAAGVPLGVAAARWPRAGQAILGAVGVIQTIPSLALFAFLIALIGAIGTLPALIALFLYALLPIVRNTHAGLEAVGRGMRQAALALGLGARDRLRLIELPLALPSILAGVKTSAVINVGTATIAAFIGAGGYGERIASGLALNDSMTLLSGAIPAAALALIVQGAFELGERRFGWMARTGIQR
ncbi:MAG: amino acid ABC transporter permease [Betaproteobacteria bacterium RIFCSPLOWO2_02_FULL_66_14]|nr:MAG: amino acid ABC transporter permease [Betaproteobacteria bacterium RIFCSPLOWO2_02_FULL_66_14]